MIQIMMIQTTMIQITHARVNGTIDGPGNPVRQYELKREVNVAIIGNK